MEGSALEPVAFETWTSAGIAVPMNRAAAAIPTTACRFRARRAGTARRRRVSEPSRGSISLTACCSIRRSASSSSASPSGAASGSGPVAAPRRSKRSGRFLRRLIRDRPAEASSAAMSRSRPGPWRSVRGPSSSAPEVSRSPGRSASVSSPGPGHGVVARGRVGSGVVRSGLAPVLVLGAVVHSSVPSMLVLVVLMGLGPVGRLMPLIGLMAVLGVAPPGRPAPLVVLAHAGAPMAVRSAAMPLNRTPSPTRARCPASARPGPRSCPRSSAAPGPRAACAEVPSSP